VGIGAYAASGAPVPASPHYPVDRSMGTFLQNPWVWACVQAVATDLSGLPLVAETGSGVSRVQSADHALLRLLRRPHPKTSGRKLRKQLVTDLKFGDGYLRVWRDPAGTPVMLGRIHPAAIAPLVGADGEEVGYTLPRTGQRLTWADVLHVADVNVTDDPSLVHGASPIEPLALSLAVERDSRRQAGRAARRGRLEMVLSPRDQGMLLGPDKVDGIVEAYAAAAESGNGVYVVNTGMEATPVSLTARDLEWASLSDRTRGEILAVFGVPESRVGSPAANYGTAKEQSRIYWATLQGLAALIDDELSRLAEPGVSIRHSFAGVDALQVAQTERQSRAVLWVREFGLSPQEAAAYENFVDLPAPAESPAAEGPADADSADADPSEDVDEPQEDHDVERARAAAVAGVLRVVAGLYSDGESPRDVERTAEMLIRQQLRAYGAPRADDAATEAALVCAASMQIHGQTGGDIVDLRAFGADHAARIVRLAEAA
jgi:HK97 family phage portal protein